jgi:hypothetical protein
MPYVSRAQAGYFHTHKAQLERQGVDVDEWDAATKGKHIPERVMKTKTVNLGSKGSFQEKPGALHAMLHVPPDQKLTAAQETPKPGDSPLLRRRKASAAGFAAMHRG